MKRNLMVLTMFLWVMAGVFSAQAANFGGPGSQYQPLSGSWQLSDGKWGYRTETGLVRNQWALIGSDWYCFNAEGVMLTGWQKSGSGKWYYLRQAADNRMGAMEHGFILDPADGYYYYLDPDTGVMRTGWVLADGNYYYFSEGAEHSIRVWNPQEYCWVSGNSAALPQGAMYRNIITEDGCLIDNEGVFVQMVTIP